MRLLLTRAAADAARTGAKLKAAGHEVLYSPLIEVMPTHASWLPGLFDGIVASSAQAFALLQSGPTPEVRRAIPLWLVGERTAAMARQADFGGAMAVAGSASGLIGRLRSGQAPRQLIYLAGEDRKPDLEAGFSALGTRVELLIVYRAEAVARLSPPARQALEDGAIDAVLHFSRRSASLFCERAPNQPTRPPTHYVLSEDAAMPLREAGYAAIRVAEAPTEAALLALIGSA